MGATFRGGQASADARAARDRGALQACDANRRVEAMETASHSPGASVGGDTFRAKQDNAELCEQLLANAGFAGTSKPRYSDVVLMARSDVIHAAASRGREEGEVYEDRSKYCVAEVPVRFPPAIFTASDQQYTKQWPRAVFSPSSTAGLSLGHHRGPAKGSESRSLMVCFGLNLHLPSSGWPSDPWRLARRGILSTSASRTLMCRTRRSGRGMTTSPWSGFTRCQRPCMRGTKGSSENSLSYC
jgi:hypothetical protein